MGFNGAAAWQLRKGASRGRRETRGCCFNGAAT